MFRFRYLQLHFATYEHTVKVNVAISLLVTILMAHLQAIVTAYKEKKFFYLILFIEEYCELNARS